MRSDFWKELTLFVISVDTFDSVAINYRIIIRKMRMVSWTTRYQNSRWRPGIASLSYFIRARDAVHTCVYIWIKYKHKQSLVKHNTPENFSLATDVSASTRFPAAMYVHRIRRYWHSLLGISELASPRLIFRSHYRGNPKWAQPASRHLRVLQTRNCPSDSGYRVPRSIPLPFRRVLTFGYSFLLSPQSRPSPPRLTRIATIQTILVIVVTLVTVAYSCYFVYSRYRWLTLAGEIRDIARARCTGIITAFFLILSYSPIRNLANLRFFQHTRYIYKIDF